MIVAAKNQDLRVITQNDHAHLAAELLALWRSDGLPEHPRRAELLFAAREHDNGWREIDAAPRVDSATQRPHDFISLPRAERLELWQRGVERFAKQQPYSSLLILQHALNLHLSLDEDTRWRPILDHWRGLSEELLAETGLSEEQLAADYYWIFLTDLISLALCHRIAELPSGHGFSGSLNGDTLHLDPFPLAGATTFQVPSRQIPQRPYRSDMDLAMELATARWGQTSFRIAPLR